MSEQYPFISDLRNSVFKKPLTQDKNTSVVDMQKDFQSAYYNFLFNGSKINSSYHESEIKQNTLIIKNIIYLCWFSFLMESIIIILSLYIKDINIAIISACSEAFINIIATVMIVILKRSSKNKKQYFNKSADAEELSKLLGTINTLKNEEAKIKLTTNLVNNYCIKYNSKFLSYKELKKKENSGHTNNKLQNL